MVIKELNRIKFVKSDIDKQETQENRINLSEIDSGRFLARKAYQ